MEDNKTHMQALQDIRQMMRQSSRFLSLSGLSGVSAGVFALTGAFIAQGWIEEVETRYQHVGIDYQEYSKFVFKCMGLCSAVLSCALLSALFFTMRKAKRDGNKMFDHTSLRLFVNLAIPLAAGAGFCLALVFRGASFGGLIAPTMLIFYGLSLVNGSRYTLHDIRYLGCLEILLGLIAAFYPGYGLMLWAVGFGVLHILYGSFMWYKYDRK